MTQTFTEGVTSLPPQEIQKQRRKQVRRQTRMMLKVEQAKRDVQKAQMKMAKAQVDREIAAARLRTCEEQLNQSSRWQNEDKRFDSISLLSYVFLAIEIIWSHISNGNKKAFSQTLVLVKQHGLRRHLRAYPGTLQMLRLFRYRN